MAKRKTRKKSKGRRFPIDLAGLFGRVSWPGIRRAGVIAAWVIGIGGILWAWVWGVPRLEAYAVTQQQATVGQIEVRFIDPPAWMKDDLLLSLSLAAFRELDNDLTPEVEGLWDVCAAPGDLTGALNEIRDALMDEGWFDSIEQVRLVRSDLIEVQATFVVPYAVIRDERLDHLIDPFGKLLPRSYQHGTAPQFIAIDNVHFDRPHRLGRKWEGTDVTAALRLLRTIEQQEWRGQVESVDVSHYHEDGQISLMTKDGNRIIWGSPPGEEVALEALADFKLHLLDEQFKRSGRIDGGFSTLDLTLQEGSFRR